MEAELQQKEMAANELPKVLKKEFEEKLYSENRSLEEQRNYLWGFIRSEFDTDFSLQDFMAAISKDAGERNDDDRGEFVPETDEFVKTGKSKKKTRRLNNLSTEASRSLASLKSALISSYHLSKSAYGIAKKLLLPASQGLLDIGRRIKRSRTKTKVLIFSFLFLSTFTIVEVFTVSRRYDARYIPYPNNINSPIMLDRNGKPIIDQYAHVLEEEKTLDAFPDILVKTVLVSEDRAFFDHWGVSFRGLARAAFRSILGNLQGGSTITQQTVKKLFIEPYFKDNFHDDSKNWGALRHWASSVRQKIHQIILAIMLEGHHDKEDILEAYLNRIYIGTEHFLDDVDGGRIFGFPEASKIYFSKDIGEISVAESAFLVSLLPAPNLPYDRKSCEQDIRFRSVEECLNDSKRARDKRIQQLLDEGVIKEDASKKALSTPIRVQLSSKAVPDRKEPLGTAPDFQSFVEDELFEILKKNNLNTDGHYIVETTLDIQSHKKAQDLLDEHIRTDGKAKRYNYGSIVSLDANDSSILVMVDGTSDSSLKGHIYSSGKYSQERMNRRLASTFKLFIYAAALEYGVIGVSRSVADGFAESLKEDALSIASKVGEERVLDLAEKSRIRGAHRSVDYETVKQQYQKYQNAEDKSKFIVLGLVESNLLDITNSFAMIANEGKLNHPYSILRVRDPNKCSENKDLKENEKLQTCEVIYSREKTMGKASERLLKPKTTEGVWQLLQSVVQYGTAKESVTSNFRLFNVGGKTGTSTDNKDLWFIGTARSQRTWDEDIRISTGVWLGNCAFVKYSSPYNNPNCDSNGSSSDAVRLWNDYMDSTLN